MIPEQDAKRIMASLARLRFFPPAEDISALREILKAIRSAPTTEIATSVVDEWIRLNRKAPLPADIYHSIELKKSQVLAWSGRGVCFDDWKKTSPDPSEKAWFEWIFSGQPWPFPINPKTPKGEQSK